MKERPILFSAPMVRALLNGTKTQTRRVVKNTGLYAIDASIHGAETAARELASLATRSPYGQRGDRLWVREAVWMPRAATKSDPKPAFCPTYLFSADVDAADLAWLQERRWKQRPSIHMPRSVCRIVLEITDVRVQRLQECSEADALAEGIIKYDDDLGYGVGFPDSDPDVAATATAAYTKLWDRINGAGAWGINPWVWALTFNRVLP